MFDLSLIRGPPALHNEEFLKCSPVGMAPSVRVSYNRVPSCNNMLVILARISKWAEHFNSRYYFK